MKEFIIKHFTTLIIVILLIILIFQRGGTNVKTFVGTKLDTSWRENNYFTQGAPIFIKGTRDTIKEKTIEYRPSENYGELLRQFEDLRAQLLTLNVYKETHKFDSSSVTVTDTIQKNAIVGRSWELNIKTPIITKTIYPAPKNYWYVGGGISGNQLSPVDNIEAGLMLKNKKDNIIGIKAGINTSGKVTYSLQKYWKIKL